MTGEEAPAPDPLAEVNQAFSGFLSFNSKAQLVPNRDPSHRAAIINPWNDESIGINVPADFAALADSLNNVYLPDRYTALWHRDSRRMEFIWTAFGVGNRWQNVIGRKFTYRFGGQEHACEFGDSSERLLEIAKNVLIRSAGNTGQRNLMSFNFHAVGKSLLVASGSPVPETRPLSFWISNIDWDEDHVLALLTNLNFYLTYYDAISPVVLIHSPKLTDHTKPQTRFPFGEFPSYIDGRELDDILLALWQASRTGDSAIRFLYCYRIIEYASFTFVEARARQEIRRILSAPHALSDTGKITQEVMDVLQKPKQDDYQRCELLLNETVKPAVLWREVKENIDAFSTPTNFDGGFFLKALVPKDFTESQFETKGIEIFHRSIRDLRNALAHGKDSKTNGVITPTSQNFVRLRPWVSLISVAASEVMLFKDVL